MRPTYSWRFRFESRIPSPLGVGVCQNGVANWLNSQDNIDLGKPKRKTYRAQDEHLNNILISFGKENELKMEKNNSPRYRGNYSPVMTNCKMVQAHFSLFKKWIFENYPKEKEATE